MINDLWYKNAILYCLSVGTYMDANGDGIGDFTGLMRRLDAGQDVHRVVARFVRAITAVESVPGVVVTDQEIVRPLLPRRMAAGPGVKFPS